MTVFMTEFNYSLCSHNGKRIRYVDLLALNFLGGLG